MTDFGAALALAKRKVVEKTGNTGYRGYASHSASENNDLVGAFPVTTMGNPVDTLVTDTHSEAFLVTSVSTPDRAMVTPDGQENCVPTQWVAEGVTNVSTVTTQNDVSVSFSGQTREQDAIRRASWSASTSWTNC